MANTSEAFAGAPAAGAETGMLSRGRLGMLCLIASEASFFSVFVVTYLFYLGRSTTGPTPAELLEVPVLNTVCLLSSSLTIALAVRALRRGRVLHFTLAWGLTLALGIEFLVGTALEWRHLISAERFVIGTNLFGTTFYSLVGLHASHVAVGAVGLALVLGLSLRGRVAPAHAERVELLSWYWHFVDAVWVVVFSVVYGIGR